jgi:hypothetical protein
MVSRRLVDWQLGMIKALIGFQSRCVSSIKSPALCPADRLSASSSNRFARAMRASRVSLVLAVCAIRRNSSALARNSITVCMRTSTSAILRTLDGGWSPDRVWDVLTRGTW